jgi:hypothetical protein
MSAPAVGDDSPVLGPARPWSNVNAVRYEVAIDTIGMVVAECSARIDEQERTATPDRDSIEHWNQIQDRCVAARRGLRVDDPQGIDEVISEYGTLLHRLRAPR